MKFSTALPEFQKLLQTAIQAVPPKSTLPVLENFSFSLAGTTLHTIATDQELTVIATLDVDGHEDGQILAPARKLLDIVKALGSTGRITLTAEPKTCKITLKTDYGEYVMNGLKAEEFPPVPDFANGITINLTADESMKIARTAVFAASKDEYRPAMTGLLLQCDQNRLNAVTTDGFRLVRVTVKSNGAGVIASEKTDVIIPVRTIDLLKKVDGDVHVLVSPTHAKFTLPQATIITRVIDERFPPYESVIPQDNDKIVRVALSDIAAAVKRVSLFANSNTKQIRLKFRTNNLTVFAEDMETGGKAQEDVVCDYAGEAFEIGFNHRFIEEAIGHLGDSGADTAAFTFSSPNRAALLKPIRNEEEQEDVLMLVMPVRL
jgi:DNA polymerase-3 subunit beta